MLKEIQEIHVQCNNTDLIKDVVMMHSTGSAIYTYKYTCNWLYEQFLKDRKLLFIFN